MCCALRGDELIFLAHRCSFAKYATGFFQNVFSISSSRLRRSNSRYRARSDNSSGGSSASVFLPVFLHPITDRRLIQPVFTGHLCDRPSPISITSLRYFLTKLRLDFCMFLCQFHSIPFRIGPYSVRNPESWRHPSSCGIVGGHHACQDRGAQGPTTQGPTKGTRCLSPWLWPARSVGLNHLTRRRGLLGLVWSCIRVAAREKLRNAGQRLPDHPGSPHSVDLRPGYRLGKKRRRRRLRAAHLGSHATFSATKDRARPGTHRYQAIQAESSAGVAG